MTSIVTTEKLLKNVLQEGNDKKETKIVPKDFYWDQIIFFLVSAIVVLSFLDISVELFRDSTVQCYIRQDDSPNRDHFTYINSYCHRSLSVSQYYLIFLFIAAVFILAPHYLWTSYFGKHFDFFFDLLKHLDRLHDPDTGEYDPLNFAYIEKLEQRFSADSETGIFKSYQLKLFIQLMTCVLGMLMNFLYFSSDDFDAEFVCDVRLNSSVWVYSDDIYCVYNSLRLLWFLWIVAGILIGLAFFSLLFGLVWCFSSHGAELGAKPVAHFCYQSCLLPDKHVSSSLLSKLKGLLSGHVSGSTALLWCWKFIKMQLVNYRRVIQPQIQSDLEFLLMKLFYADSGHGQVFRDIQINKELQTMFEQDHELLHLLLRAHADMMKQQS